MAEKTPNNPLGMDFESQPDFVSKALKELYNRANALPPSREKSIILTKCDEIRHWLNDIVKKEI